MSLIKCPECGKEISNKSVQCIYCGCPLKEGDSREKTFNKPNFTNTLTKVLNNLLIKIKNSFETFWGKPHGKIVVIVCLCVFVFLSFVTWVEATKGEKLDWNEEIYWPVVCLGSMLEPDCLQRRGSAGGHLKQGNCPGAGRK